jgi:acyl carrier protein
MNSAAPDQDDVISVLRDFLAAEKPEETSAAGDEDNLFDAGVLDSFQLVSLVAFIEDEFGCALDFGELTEENLASLSAIRGLVQRKRGETRRSS